MADFGDGYLTFFTANEAVRLLRCSHAKLKRLVPPIAVLRYGAQEIPLFDSDRVYAIWNARNGEAWSAFLKEAAESRVENAL